MFLDAFREQALAAALSPAGKDRATAFGLHPGTKTVLTFACSLGGLVSPFHKTDKASVIESGYTRNEHGIVNRARVISM
jgi:hypothetical protein